MAPVVAPEPVIVPEPVAVVVPEPEAAPEPHFADELALDLVDEIVEDEVVAADPVVSTNVMPLVRPEPVVSVTPLRPSDMRPGLEEGLGGERPPTLFEKMMNLSRGPAKPAAAVAPMAPVSDPSPRAAGEDPLEIPHFFKRQVND